MDDICWQSYYSVAAAELTEHLETNTSLDGRHQFGVGRLTLVGGVESLAAYFEHL